ncbi:MAG: hypothetical protein RID09_04525, partial [Coleofasciculus sp. G1-WW12-02]|uniref:hypothetical protein n=1 Tax=Coleofasciculus sp. G1-WW12-02 TaxID=3068483 RepID=UPI0032F65685
EKLNSFKVTETVLFGQLPTDNLGEANFTPEMGENRRGNHTPPPRKGYAVKTATACSSLV